ncbi:MAG: hypothetical protein MUE40_06030 [Anaerolineae bacterium]|jgi:hypothetical protein|nr:hypothetical protein [Anaerolineae bacterium]
MMAGQTYRRYAGGWLLMITLLAAACSPAPAPDRPLPTVALLPTESAPATADTEPTPTREDAPAAPGTAAPTLSAGSGVNLDPAALSPFDRAGAAFAARVDGVETLQLAAGGSLTCDEQGAFVLASAADAAAVPRLSFILPPEITPGVYPLRDVIVRGVEIRPVLVLESGVTYDVNLDGLFVLTALPPAGGGTMQGEFEYAAGALVNPVQTILVRGSFAFNVAADFCR